MVFWTGKTHGELLQVPDLSISQFPDPQINPTSFRLVAKKQIHKHT